MDIVGVLEFLHVLTAMWFIAGILGRQLTRAQARRTGDLHTFEALTTMAGRFESLMVIPGNMLVILFGVLTAWLGDWPIFGFLQGAEENWLLLSNLLLLTFFPVIPLVYLPRGRRFDQALTEAKAAGRMTPALESALDDPVVRLAHLWEYVALFVVVGLMVLKPF